jgi:hypothetical protein
MVGDAEFRHGRKAYGGVDDTTIYARRPGGRDVDQVGPK